MREPVTLYTAVSPFELLSHLQALYGCIHALDVLSLQNNMQHYHLDMEGILEYVNALDYAQKRSKRVGNPITEDTLLLIATNDILSTDSFPREDERWEKLPKNKKILAFMDKYVQGR